MKQMQHPLTVLNAEIKTAVVEIKTLNGLLASSGEGRKSALS
jgi:hypothetical protein